MRAPSPAVAGARVTANGDSRYTCDLTRSKVSNVCSKAATCGPKGPLWQARAWGPKVHLN